MGDKVALGPGEREQTIASYYAHDNDFEITMLAGDPPLWPRTRAEIEAEHDEDAKKRDRRWVGFTIYDRATTTPIGDLGLRDIDWVTGCATLGISIYRKDYWGKGYGTEAMILLLDYAFTVLGLYNIMLDTFAYNERALASYRKVGFKEIGRRREAQRLGDRRYDIVYMDILRAEFHGPLKPVITLP
ncbi:MAG TPA: GNAT family protein [Ktedonobacterales bacterium]|nr:GNAT family protein [Ktedonobacterales bacterium]